MEVRYEGYLRVGDKKLSHKSKLPEAVLSVAEALAAKKAAATSEDKE